MIDSATTRACAGASILRDYQDAGAPFDGIHQLLLPHLRELRHRAPRPWDETDLIADLGRLGIGDLRRSAHPDLVVDAGVLLAYAELGNRTVGAALVDAVTDPACEVVVSELAYLEAVGRAPHQERRMRQLLRHQDFAAQSVATLAPVTAVQGRLAGRLGGGRRPVAVHTVLLASERRCVIGTLQPAPYHRLGYRRTVDLTE